MIKDFQKVKLLQIDQDETFRIKCPLRGDSLIESIRELGLINPPLLLEQHPQKYIIILGFRRIEAMIKLNFREIDAFILKVPFDHKDLFRFVMRSHMSERPFSPVELSNILVKLRTCIHIPDDEIVDEFFPILGLGKNPKLLELYGSLHLLEPELKFALDEGQLNLEVVSEMILIDNADRKGVFELFQILRLGKNKQRDFWRLVSDLAKIRNQSISDILQENLIQNILAQELTQAQKYEQIKEALWRQRYPQYSSVANAFKSLIKDMRLPPRIVIHPPAFFEGEDFQLYLKFKDSHEYGNYLGLLEHLQRKGYIDRLVKLGN